jgi:hypothetical protein
MKVHVLDAQSTSRYRVVLHTPMPVGNNSAGVTWKAAYLAAGLAVSILPVGSAPGTTTQAEHDAILAGDTIEILGEIPAESGGATSASVTQMADALIASALSVLQARLRYYGYAQAT